MEAYPCGHYPVFEGYNHMQYQIRDPKGFAEMLAHIAELSANTRFHMMYEKAKEDKTFKTDMAEEEFMRVTVHTMMTACAYYAGGFIWGSKENEDYTPELIKLKEMILAYVKA